MKVFLAKNFQLVLIFILTFGLMFTYNSYNNEKIDKQRILNEIEVGKVITDIEQPGLEEIKKREKQEKELSREIEELKKKIESIKKEKNKNNLKDRKNAIQKADLSIINNHFRLRNYSTSVSFK